jgi:MscS family membrane protein
MKARLELFSRAFALVLLLCLGWSLWASAQSITNTNKTTETTNATRLEKTVERLQSHAVTFGLDKIAPLREHEFLDEPLWKYVASLVYFLLAFVVAKVIDFLTQLWLKRLATRTGSTIDDLVLVFLRGPIKVVAFVILANIGLNFFEWSDTTKLYLSRALIVIVAGSLTYLAIKLVTLSLTIWRRRTARDADGRFNDQLFSFLRITSIVVVITIAVLVTAQNLNINITAALASLSVGGLAVGLAAQDTLGNLFGAVAVFVDKPFQLGDYIKLDSTEGIVEAVGLRSTRLRNPEGQLVAVPNKTMGNAIITNTSERPSIKTTLNLTLPRTVPADAVKRALAILDEIYRRHPMTQKVWVSFNQINLNGLNIVVVHWWKGTDYEKYLAGIQEMNLAVKQRFDAESIPLAGPGG